PRDHRLLHLRPAGAPGRPGGHGHGAGRQVGRRGRLRQPVRLPRRVLRRPHDRRAGRRPRLAGGGLLLGRLRRLRRAVHRAAVALLGRRRAAMSGPAAGGAGQAGGITRALERAPVLPLALYAVAAAFATYFCMYAFRKPFAAAAYEGYTLGPLDLKGALIIGQVAGYALSKLIGVKVNSEMPHARRRLALILLILWAEA